MNSFLGVFSQSRDEEQGKTKERQSGTFGFRWLQGPTSHDKPYRPGTPRKVYMQEVVHAGHLAWVAGTEWARAEGPPEGDIHPRAAGPLPAPQALSHLECECGS